MAGITAFDEYALIYSLVAGGGGGEAAGDASSGVPASLVAECKAAGEAVASLKKGGGSKADVEAAVGKLLALKQQITALDPSHALAIADKKKKKADAAAPAPEAAGGEKKLSKKEQKRLARGDEPAKKKVKDPNRWAVDPAKAAEKAAKAKAKAERAAQAEKEDADAIAPPTPVGDRKILAKAMAKTYKPADVEGAWQEWWEKSGWYGCDEAAAAKKPDSEKFVIVIPPPNVTGSLHLGHALTAAIEDCLTRWHRMRGHATLYVPGTDHAGIATQSVVEKQLAKQHPPVSRHDLGRDKFLEQVWAWKGEYGGKICNQLRRLGSSVDWSRERFTMDDRCAKAVTEAFVRFHDAGIMYRASRLVNWSCALKSAISDLEVDHLELAGGEYRAVPGHDPAKKYQFGMFTEFAYDVLGADGKATGEQVVVATTRLETMLGDVAVAVHPDDARYAHLVGKKLKHPFFPQRDVVVVADGELVDMDKGTGCVKVTPAHDPKDYECGKRHGLPFMTIFTLDGRVVAEATPFAVGDAGAKSSKVFAPETFPAWVAGSARYDARELCERKLDELGLLRGKETRAMNLAVCSRSGDIIEPLVQPQWYVDCSGPAKRACDAVRSGELRILPKMHEKTWFQWLENIRPWCISRQLWWGHRIPAWFAFYAGEDRGLVDMNSEANKPRWIVARDEAEALAKAKATLGRSDVELQRDEDVLDTWFSSGLFPFSVFGWPDKTPELDAFYPTQLLETGLDILFFWVARMVMMGLQLTDKLPFTDVYLHAMVRDKEGRKMSKSLGNVIDPLEVIDGCKLEQLVGKLKGGNLKATEVAKATKAFEDDFPDGMPRCGTDALRVGLLAYTVQGRDINLDIKRVIGYRSFCNKLWNAVRFMLGCFDGYAAAETIWADLAAARGKLAGRDKFVLSKLHGMVAAVDEHLTGYCFGDCVQAIYAFFLNDLCDVYVELVKPVVYGDDKTSDPTLAKMALWCCLDAGLRCLHVMCPFVTEELWQRLPRKFAVSSIMVAPYPRPADTAVFVDAGAEAGVAVLLEATSAARSLRAQYNLGSKPAKFVAAFSGDAARAATLAAFKADVATLARASAVDVVVDAAPPAGCGQKLVDEKFAVYVDLKGLVDVKAEIAKLEKELKTVAPLVDKLRAKLADPVYVAKAPAKQRANDEAKLASYADKVAAAEAGIASWSKMGDAPAAGGDDDDDFWGDDDDQTEEEKAAAAKKLEEAKAKAMAKLAKKEVAQRSLCALEIKPWEAEQDLEELFKKIKSTFVREGLKWSEVCKLEDVAFGVKKIICTAVINQTMSMDAIIEEITEEAFADEVQSMTMTSMSLL